MTIGSSATAEASRSGVGPTAGIDAAYPTRRDEAWRYAPHRELGRLVFGPSPDAVVDLPDDIESQIPAIDGPRIVIVNGIVDDTRSDLAGLADGLTVTPLATAIEQGSGAVAAHFDADGDIAADTFVAVNRAYGRDGAVVSVEPGRTLDRPVHIVDITVPGHTPNATSTGVVVDVGAGSTATVIETHVGAGPAFGGSNARTTIVLGERAALTHLVLQDLPADQIQLARIEVRQEAGSEFHARSFNLGASYGRIDYQVRLAGEEATADLAGLYFGFGEQTLDQQITVVHDAGDCTSRQTFRGVLDDRSTGVFNGGIAVSPGADGTDAEQANDNLVLSTQAEVNTQPRLEILADDVACKHGATVGQLDDDALYYLRSRGVPAGEARRLLIAGFAAQTVEEVEYESVRAWVSERLGDGHA